MDHGNITFLGQLAGTRYDDLVYNDVLNAFRISVNGSLSVQNMIDGIVDEFEDESGVDTVTSTNEDYDSTNDYYQPYREAGGYTVDVMPTDGSGLSDQPGTAESTLKNICDDDTDTYYWTQSTPNNSWFQIDFGSGNEKTITKITLDPYQNRCKDWRLLGSNTGSFSGEETEVASGTHGNNSNKETWTFENETAYRYYRIHGDNMYVGTELYLAEWEMMESTDPVFYNMSLQSNSNTAESQPDYARIVIFEEDVDAITINTDLKAYVSRDGGTTWSQVTLADEGDYDTNKRVLAGTVDISGQPSGTSMKYKLTTHNTKDLKIHGVGLLWS